MDRWWSFNKKTNSWFFQLDKIDSWGCIHRDLCKWLLWYCFYVNSKPKSWMSNKRFRIADNLRKWQLWAIFHRTANFVSHNRYWKWWLINTCTINWILGGVKESLSGQSNWWLYRDNYNLQWYRLHQVRK